MKSWTITLGQYYYDIQLQRQTVIINGQTYLLKELPCAVNALFFREYRLPIEGSEVLLTTGWASMHLVVDGRDAVTGNVYASRKNMPKWSIVFFILQAFNLVNGLIGFLATCLGISLTMQVMSKPNLSTIARVLLSILILICCWVGVLILAFLLAFMRAAW